MELQKSGFDIICTKSLQNKCFIGNRGLELAKLKTIVDAVQSTKFISLAKSRFLIERLASLGSPYQADQLKRNLYVDGKIKTNNKTSLRAKREISLLPQGKNITPTMSAACVCQFRYVLHRLFSIL